MQKHYGRSRLLQQVHNFHRRTSQLQSQLSSLSLYQACYEAMGSSEEYCERPRPTINKMLFDGALQVVGNRPQVLNKLVHANRWVDRAHQQPH